MVFHNERRQQMWDSVLTTHSTGNHIYVVESDAGNIAGFVSAGLEREEPTAKLVRSMSSTCSRNIRVEDGAGCSYARLPNGLARRAINP